MQDAQAGYGRNDGEKRMEIIWSDLANQNLDSILDYVEENFGITTANKTLRKIDEKVSGLINFPESGVLDRKYSTEEYTVHHFTLAPNVVYYMLYPDAIVIGVIVHTKQSPKTVDKILKKFLEHYER